MANNLHISYDLSTPGQNYEAVIDRIKQLGGWAKIHFSFWFVDSNYTAAQAVDHISPALATNDRVYVVDAANNSAAWNKLPSNVESYIKNH